MEIKKDTKVKIPYRPDLGTGAVLQVLSHVLAEKV